MSWDVYLQEEKWLTLREMKGFVERFRGYMAKNLNNIKEEGLWFPDCHSLHTCFMKFPLDLYFLDGEHKVLSVHENVKNGRFISHRQADSVIELPAASKSLLKVGDCLRFVPCP